MAGLDKDGFVPLGYDEIRTRIQGRLEQYNQGFDFTASSPDGQLVDIFSFELSQAWQQLDAVYRSYDPAQAFGAGLRNLGLITGIPFEAAARSFAYIELTGVDGSEVPTGTIFTDDAGNEFATQFPARIPTNVTVYALASGPIPVPAGTIKNIKVPVTGLHSISQPINGVDGGDPITEDGFRNIRNRTVLRNFSDASLVISSRLLELGVNQVEVINNDTNAPFLPPDNTPARTIQVVVGELDPNITDEEIARTILAAKAQGVPTYGTTTVSVTDSQGHAHDVSFSKATGVDIYVRINLVFYSEDFAGAIENIQRDVSAHINNLLAGEDVIRSRLYGLITPYAEADVQQLELSYDGMTWVETNLSINADQYAKTDTTKIPVIDNTP